MASLYTLQTNGDQTIVAYISGTIMLALLSIVLVYHTVTELYPVANIWSNFKLKLKKHDNEISLAHYHAADDLRERLNPTVTLIEAPSSEEGALVFHTEGNRKPSHLKDHSL